MFHSYSFSEVLMQFLSTKIISLSDILYHIDSFCFAKKKINLSLNSLLLSLLFYVSFDELSSSFSLHFVCIGLYDLGGMG